MPTLQNGSGALRINVPRGSSLIIRNQSGVETVTGSSVAREDATFALGANAVVYGPQSASSDVSISTTGVLTYDIVAGDPTPASTPAAVARSASTGAPSGLIDPATGQPLGGGGGMTLKPYTGIVASRGGVHYNKSPVNQIEGSMRCKAYVRLEKLRIRDENWYGNVVATSSDLTIKRTIEYPIGTTPQPFTYGGAAAGVVASGNSIESDELTLSTPIPAGADFFVHYYVVGTNGVPFGYGGGQSVYNGNVGDRLASGASVPDTTGIASTSKASSQSTFVFRHAAILGTTDQPTFFLFGDSRISGQTYDLVSDSSCFIGNAERRIGRTFACINFSVASNRISGQKTAAQLGKRMELAAYCSHVVSDLGGSDIFDFATPPNTVLADIKEFCATMNAAVGYKPIYWMTIEPKTSQPDGGGTPVQDANRQSVNAALRWGMNTLAGTVDSAAVYEDPQNPTIWKRGHRVISDAAITSGQAILTSATANFSYADVGHKVSVTGAGAAGALLSADINSVTNSTTAVLNTNAGTTVSGASAGIRNLCLDGTHASTYGFSALEADPVVWRVIPGL